MVIFTPRGSGNSPADPLILEKPSSKIEQVSSRGPYSIPVEALTTDSYNGSRC